MPTAPDVLLGRDEEVRDISAAIRGAARIVIVRGPRGVGKTTLASEVYRLFDELDVSMDFVDTTPGHRRQLASILVDFLHAIGGQPAGLSSSQAIMAELTVEAEALGGPGLYYVDNLEPDILQSIEFTDVCKAWLSADHELTLMVTVRSEAPHRPWPLVSHPAVRELTLGGLTDDDAQLTLLGTELRRSHSERDLLDAARALAGNPQMLLGMRWSRSNPKEFVESVQRGGRIWETPELFAEWLSNSGLDSLCLALGVLRNIEYDTSLLAHLWQSGLGTQSVAWEEALTILVREQVLSPAARPDTLRVHPWVHSDLGLLAESKPRGWPKRVHNAAADYFGTALDTETPLAAASEFVYHAVKAGRSREVWDILVEKDHIESWRRAGRSVQASDIVDSLWADVEPRPDYTRFERAELLVKRAHIASDMGQPRVCVGLLEDALRELGAKSDALYGQLRRAAWTQLAISHANLGEIEPCIQYYTRVVRADQAVADPRTALAMGYLAYEYCDIGRLADAENWIKLALERCPRTRDASIFAKNLCNQGLVRFFALDFDGATVSFDEAIDLVSAPDSDGFDVREHGRVLAHRGMVMLSSPRGSATDALAMLDRAQELNERAGDRRRVYISMGRRGVAYARLGEPDEAWRLLTRAAAGHQRLGDTKSLAIEVLALMGVARMFASGNAGAKVLTPSLSRLSRNLEPGGSLERYATAWHRAYSLMLEPVRAPAKRG